MQCTPSPPKLPPRPLTVGIYKTLPDASNADLPPKPPITPNSLSPTSSHLSRAALTHSSNKSPRCRKRKYLQPADSFVVPLQHDETAERAAKVHRTSLDRAIVHTHKDSNKNVTSSRHPHSWGWTMHRRPPDMTGFKTPLVKLQLIHDNLIRGAKTITRRDQEFLAVQLHINPTCVSTLMMWRVAKQITNKTCDLSRGILYWASDHNELELMEYILTDRLHTFDLEEAFEQGLMGIQEATDLMEYQILLPGIQKRLKEKQKKLVEHSTTNASFDADHYESDVGSADMDLS
ncbi:hypothetical protein F4679DRAFT_588250 [Xylaria curta]|nr:hypothetical protein F4679DRAFT_588250 [Xylaria curta]